MARYTNTTRGTIDLVVKGDPKDGIPPTESLAPGETRSIPNAIDNAQLRGLLHAGALVQETTARATSKD